MLRTISEEIKFKYIPLPSGSIQYIPTIIQWWEWELQVNGMFLFWVTKSSFLFMKSREHPTPLQKVSKSRRDFQSKTVHDIFQNFSPYYYFLYQRFHPIIHNNYGNMMRWKLIGVEKKSPTHRKSGRRENCMNTNCRRIRPNGLWIMTVQHTRVFNLQ